MKIIFTQATINDIPAIKRLLRENWFATYLDVYSQDKLEKIISEWHSPELLTQQIKNPDMCFLVAKNNNEVIGLCNAFLKDKTIIIERLHISKEYQHQGIGSMLLNKVIDAFPFAKLVELDVEKHNEKAISFYEKQNFKITGATTITFQGETMYCKVMQKELLKKLL